MTNQEKYLKWLEIAEEDLITAEVMLNNGRYSYVAFMCEQALEKIAKGIFVYKFNEEAPFTHNINIILQNIENIVDDEKYKNYEVLLGRLTSYYIVGRYDVYKQKISGELSESECEKLLQQSKEVFEWLKSRTK